MDQLIASPQSVAIFMGRAMMATTIQGGQIVTFDVSRIWKGETDRTAVIYLWLDRGFVGDAPVPFKVGTEYLITAQRQSAGDAVRFGLSPENAEGTLATYTANACVTRPFDTLQVQSILNGAPGRPPQ